MIVDGKYWRCRNIADDPTEDFVMDPRDYALASFYGKVEGVVHSSSSALLEVGLSNSLLVKTTPRLSPYKLGRLFTLKSKRLGFGGSKEDGLSITTDKKLSGSRPNPVLGHCA